MKIHKPTIVTRRKARECAEEASPDGVLDLTECEFVGGGVADELLWAAEDLQFELRVSDNSVAQMLTEIGSQRVARGATDVPVEKLVTIVH